MSATAINLYTVRDLDEPLDRILERIATAGYDGVQFGGPFTPTDETADHLARILGDLELEATPAHIGIDTLRGDLELVLPAYQTVGVDSAVVPWLPPDEFTSTASVDAVAGDLAELSDQLAEWGWTLAYHNHAHEYDAMDGEFAFERLLRRTDIDIELDVGWALVGGDDPAQRIRSLGDRLRTVHLKDMAVDEENGFREIGDGDVDFESCMEAVNDADVEWLIYEHDAPDDPIVSIETGAAYLEQLLEEV